MTRQAGVSLIEVLIALLVLSVGILGMVALQTRTLALERETHLRSQASNLAYDLGDRMRANATALEDYALGLGDDAPQGGSLASEDLQDWLGDLQASLPRGEGGVDIQGDEALITVAWASSPSLGGDQQRFDTWVRP